MPDGISINPKGIAHYQQVIDDLKSKHITPLLTLYHWDLPQSVYDITNGGWINSSIVDYYLAYADAVFDAFNQDVKLWLTFNEPWTFCQLGYGDGTHAPGRCTNRTVCPPGGNSSIESYLCAHNVLLSHSAAVNLFRERGYDQYGGQIGITLNSDWAEPASSSAADVAAAQRKILWSLAWFSDPVWFGDYPQEMRSAVGSRLPMFTPEQSQMLKGSWDFFGLNSYTTQWVADAPVYNGSNPTWETDQAINVSPINQYNDTVIGVPAASSWLYVVPWGIQKMLDWVDQRYSRPPIYVTENGVDVPGENSMPMEQALNDTFRVNFYSQYISNVMQAKANGLNILGYFAWSLMDNFEWADGYRFRFGIHYVDYAMNLTRYQKDSAKWYSNFTKHNP
jgi:beta-glucosidase